MSKFLINILQIGKIRKAFWYKIAMADEVCRVCCKEGAKRCSGCKLLFYCSRCGSRIRLRGGPQLLRPKVADVAKRSCTSEASNLQPGSRARLRALEAFGFLMLKYAFSHILETLFLSFLTSILTPKVDKNRALDFTSINWRHSYILLIF